MTLNIKVKYVGSHVVYPSAINLYVGLKTHSTQNYNYTYIVLKTI